VRPLIRDVRWGYLLSARGFDLGQLVCGARSPSSRDRAHGRNKLCEVLIAEPIGAQVDPPQLREQLQCAITRARPVPRPLMPMVSREDLPSANCCSVLRSKFRALDTSMPRPVDAAARQPQLVDHRGSSAARDSSKCFSCGARAHQPPQISPHPQRLEAAALRGQRPNDPARPEVGRRLSSSHSRSSCRPKRQRRRVEKSPTPGAAGGSASRWRSRVYRAYTSSRCPFRPAEPQCVQNRLLSCCKQPPAQLSSSSAHRRRP